MIVEVEHQRQGVDLIKIDNDETKITFKFGASIGRYSGRIDNDKFKLKGKEYQL